MKRLLPLLLLAGCTAGRHFALPDPASLSLGVTTRADVVTRLGEPLKSGTLTMNGETVQYVHYSYVQKHAADIDVWGFSIRSLVLYFVDDRLIGYESSSSFDEDKTDFDTSKVAMIKNGVTTRDEVVALLGRPSGLVRHPIVPGKDEEALVYLYAYPTSPEHKSVDKRARVVLGPTGIVRRSEASARAPDVKR